MESLSSHANFSQIIQQQPTPLQNNSIGFNFSQSQYPPQIQKQVRENIQSVNQQNSQFIKLSNQSQPQTQPQPQLQPLGLVQDQLINKTQILQFKIEDPTKISLKTQVEGQGQTQIQGQYQNITSQSEFQTQIQQSSSVATPGQILYPPPNQVARIQIP